jgi:hypothetical protein
MGIQHEHGYSAEVEGFLVIRGERVRLAKTNAHALVLAESCELPPGAVGELLIIVDGKSDSRLVTLPSGVCKGQTLVNYQVAAPF